MNILPPTPVIQELGAAPSPAGNGTPNSGATANTAQASFTAVLAQVNQQGVSPKATGGKDSSGTSTPLSLTQGETDSEGLGVSPENVPPVAVSPLILPLVVPEAVPISSSEIIPILPGALKSIGENPTGNSSQPIALVPEALGLVADEPDNVGSPRGVSLPPIPVTPNANNPISEKILPPAPPIIQNDQYVPAPATREPLVLEPPVNRLAVPSVPLSFVNAAFPQGQPVVDPVNVPKLSPVISQNIQNALPVSTGSPNLPVIDGAGNSNHSVVVDERQAETGGSSLGSDQKSSQDNGSAFSTKQQASGQGLAGFSFNTELGNEFRANEASAAGRTDMLADRTRTMNLLSPQRMQMEVMLSDESKVQLEVSVKNQQVTAQLLTDQMMLRNLALQHEPQLDAQLFSAGLELKQFGAEVSEHGMFGQHLSGSSQNAHRGDGHEVSSESEPEVLSGAQVEADGRLHYVA